MKRPSRWLHPTFVLALNAAIGLVVVVVIAVVVFVHVVVCLQAKPKRPHIFCSVWVFGDSRPDRVGRGSSPNLLVAVRALPKLHCNRGKLF